jgi:translation initiation factor IF-2
LEISVATTLRVHSLAKELGVPSKVVLDKCRAEGIELKNHMAAISVGLAESIREWFSVGVDVTSVEVADRVDVEKVRGQRRRKRMTEETAGEQEAVGVEATCAGIEGGETAVAEPEEAAPDEGLPGPAEPMPEIVVAQSAAPVITEPESAAPVVETPETLAPAAVVEPAVVAPVAPTPPTEPPPSVPAETAAPQIPPPVPPVVAAPPPAPVLPAGPQVVPRPAALQGPRVVRVEAPEPTRTPRPRVGTIAARGPVGAPTAPSTEAGAARRGRGAKGRKQTEEESARARSRSPRRHGANPTEVDQRVREWRDQDLLERKERLASVTGHGLRDRRAAERRRQATQPGAVQTTRKDPVAITTPITLKEFCAAVGAPFMVVSKKLLEQTGRLWTINQSIDAEQAEIVALELGIPLTVAKAKTAYERLQDEFAGRERQNLQPRPPVVAMLGHVDHGKTSLLDAIRSAHVAAGEAGGITQHIGAYRIDKGDWHVAFVDTPGHQAFTAMRARGANLTDVVVLVVAADDGVMPQTIEAINHAKAAGVAIVVALNKIDLPGVDLNRIYAQLAEQGLTPSEWGGTTDVIKTSATTKQGINELVAHLSTLSELMELKADPDVPARATVIEAQVREGHGVVAQVLVREGTLALGQIIVCGPGAGRVRALTDDRGQGLKAAGPGTPVEVAGLDELPSAGDTLFVVDNLARAKDIAEEVLNQRRQAALDTTVKPKTLEALMAGATAAEVPELAVIIRADVQGSVEVLRKSLEAFPANKARLNILQTGVGAITDSDVQLAKASGALIIGFHVVAENSARQLAEQLGVEIRVYRVIYEMLDDLHKALAGLLEPTRREEARGTVEVRQVFNVSRVGTIAGCYVTDGLVNRNHKVRLVRDGRIILEHGTIGSLKRFKDDAREVRAGLECGIKIDNYDDIKPGDVIQSYELVEVAQEL